VLEKMIDNFHLKKLNQSSLFLKFNFKKLQQAQISIVGILNIKYFFETFSAFAETTSFFLLLC